MMEILLFGIARDIVGDGSLTLTDTADMPSSVAELRTYLVRTYPEFGKLSTLAIAVNSEYANDTVSLGKGDEIAVIPPVSGG